MGNGTTQVNQRALQQLGNKAAAAAAATTPQTTGHSYSRVLLLASARLETARSFQKKKKHGTQHVPFYFLLAQQPDENEACLAAPGLLLSSLGGAGPGPAHQTWAMHGPARCLVRA